MIRDPKSHKSPQNVKGYPFSSYVEYRPAQTEPSLAGVLTLLPELSTVVQASRPPRSALARR